MKSTVVLPYTAFCNIVDTGFSPADATKAKRKLIRTGSFVDEADDTEFRLTPVDTAPLITSEDLKIVEKFL